MMQSLAGSGLETSVCRPVAGVFGTAVHLLFVVEDDRLRSAVGLGTRHQHRGVRATSKPQDHTAAMAADHAEWTGTRCLWRLLVDLAACEQIVYGCWVVNGHIVVVDRLRLNDCVRMTTNMTLG